MDLDFTLDKEVFYYQPRDKNNIPVKLYQSVGQQYNPTRISSFALAHYNRYMRHDNAENLDVFMKMAEWFMRDKNGLWYYNFDWGDLCAPWLSCMSQGEGISVLVRAYKVTGDEKYLEKAIQSTIPLKQSIEAGGVRSFIDNDSVFLEEYPTKTPIHVLNGFLYAMIGLIELRKFKPECVNALDFDGLLDTLVNNIGRWDLGYWSAYDLSHETNFQANACTVSYHNLHISQLSFVADQTGRPELIDTVKRWQVYAASPINRVRAFYSKVKFRIKVPAQR